LLLCLSVYIWVCVRAVKENDLSYQPTELGRHDAYGSFLACIDPEVKRSQGQGHMVIKCTAGMDMQIDKTVDS